MATITYQDKEIYYRKTGAGSPVMLVHGFGEDGNIWQDLTDDLQRNFEVVVPDIPGSGKSEMLEGERFLTDYAAVLEAIATQEFGKKSFTMIGHSMGGYITLAFAEKYKGKLNAFGLFHSSAYADSEEKKETRRKGIDFIGRERGKAFNEKTAPNMFAPQTKENRPEQVKKLLGLANNITDAALMQYSAAMIARPDHTALLKNTPLPVLFIMGRHDQAIPMEAMLEQCHMPGQSEAHILEDSGHMGMWEEAEKSNQEVRHFLESLLG